MSRSNPKIEILVKMAGYVPLELRFTGQWRESMMERRKGRECAGSLKSVL